MREKIQSHFSCQKSKRRKVQLWFYWSFEVLLVTWVANSMVWHEELHSKTCKTVAYLLLCAGKESLSNSLVLAPEDWLCLLNLRKTINSLNQWLTGHGWNGLFINAERRRKWTAFFSNLFPYLMSLIMNAALLMLCCWLLETP